MPRTQPELLSHEILPLKEPLVDLFSFLHWTLFSEQNGGERVKKSPCTWEKHLENRFPDVPLKVVPSASSQELAQLRRFKSDFQIWIFNHSFNGKTQNPILLRAFAINELSSRWPILYQNILLGPLARLQRGWFGGGPKALRNSLGQLSCLCRKVQYA